MAGAGPGDTLEPGTQSRCSGKRPSNRLILLLAYSSHSVPEPDPVVASQLPIRVLLVISSRLERLGWSIVIQNQTDLELVGEFPAFDGALATLLANRADVVLIDEALLTPKRCDLLRRESARLGCRFLLVASYPIDEELGSGRYAFASDCLLKGISAPDLLAALRATPDAVSPKSAPRPDRRLRR